MLGVRTQLGYNMRRLETYAASLVLWGMPASFRLQRRENREKPRGDVPCSSAGTETDPKDFKKGRKHSC